MEKILRAAGGGGKGAEQHTPEEAPDTLKSIQYARVLDAISEGEIVGPVDADNLMKNVYLNETPIQNEDGSFNFKNVVVDFRSGTQDQEPMPDFPDVENELGVGVLVETDTPYTHAFTNLDLDALRVTLQVTALTEADTETADINGYRIEYAIDLATDGGPFVQVVSDAFDGKTTSPYQVAHVLILPEAVDTGWIVRVRRITPDADSVAIQDDMNVSSITEIIYANLRYSNTAYFGVSVDASQFNSIPSRAYKCRGRIIMVPSNYDPETANYTGIWDGTFQPLYSNNPAWCYYDMIINDRYGLGHLIVPYYIDKWTLYQIAQYCDGMVDDGKGGTERRFTCNVYFQSAVEAYKLIQDMASVFRGMAYWANSTVMTSADMPGSPVYTYTNANVKNGKFTYSGTARKTRHTVALIGYSDPRDFYRGKIEPVFDDEGIARYGPQILKATAIACTSQGMAHRVGKWMLLSERLLTDTVTFDVGLDGTVAAPGQLINVADQFRAGVRNGGRIKTATTTVIEPDALPLSSVPGDVLTVTLPNGTAQSRSIASIASGAFTVSPGYDEAPLTDAAWGVSSVAVEMQLFKVIAVMEAGEDEESMGYSIVALESNQDIYEAVETGLVVQEPNYSLVPSKIVPSPSSVTVSTYEVVDGAGVTVVLAIDWTQVTDAVSYDVEYKRSGDNWSPKVRVPGTHYEVRGVPPGDYTARVYAVNSLGAVSLATASAAATVPPPTVYEMLMDEDTGEILVDEDTGEILYGEL